ncbi:MAG: bifunctional pantoate--beta-alanine ligase/(d)CMP kinase [Elainella sp.]
MRVFTTVAGLRCYLGKLRAGQHQPPEQDGPRSSCYPLDGSVGLVPTMGALHDGHLSLIHRARQENAWVVVSIFVNPLQFGPNEDFKTYPRQPAQDQQLCEQAGVDVLFIPSVEELYGHYNSLAQETQGMKQAGLTQTGLTQVVPPTAMIAKLCGQARPGHFTGVATVVTKLFNIVQPDRAYFGQKDAQQEAVLQKLVADLHLPVELRICPIVRESDGLALSSRNQYLSPEQRTQAAILNRGLRQAEQTFRAGGRLRQELIGAVQAELQTVPTVQPEYIDLVHPETMLPLQQVEEAGLLAVAARIGSTRLIDNLVLRNRQPIVAIDGPAGAGKSTVVRQVAQVLGLLYLDTGAMYRAVTWLVLQANLGVGDEADIAELVSQCQIDISGNPAMARVAINGQDITAAIRSPEVTAQVSAVSALPSVRRELVKRQQDYGRRGGIVMDGRDIGTCVFPDAELKVFLTASVQERARRRQQDLKNQGQTEISLTELERTIYERDLKDSTRRIAPLRRAEDAIEIQSDHLTIDQVVAKIVALYHERVDQPGATASPILN